MDILVTSYVICMYARVFAQGTNSFEGVMHPDRFEGVFWIDTVEGVHARVYARRMDILSLEW